MEILALRPVCMSAGGIYRIDYDCVANFIQFISSYIISIVNI